MAKKSLDLSELDLIAEATEKKSRGKHHAKAHPHEEEEGEPWLLSFADLVTLLMCFFILFFSVDKSKGAINDPQRLKEKLEAAIGMDAEVLVPPSAATPDASSPSDSTSTSNMLGGTLNGEQEAENFAKQMKGFAEKLKVVFGLSTTSSGTLELTFLSLNFFEPGSAVMTASGSKMLERTVPKLLSLDPQTLIEVEGHTDSDPIKSPRFASNVELSLIRAATVARFLENHGVPPRQIKVSGFGPNRPILPEKNELGITNISAKRLNRRVIIRLSQPQTKPASPSKSKG